MTQLKYLSDLESALGYEFRDKSLLNQALTHSSYANAAKPRVEDNERLEWLGDSLIGSAVSLRLYALYGANSEAQLTKARSAIVSRAALSRIGAALKLNEYIYILDSRVASNLNILANTVEALIGAMYLDWTRAMRGGEPATQLDCINCAARSANPVEIFINKFINFSLRTQRGNEGLENIDPAGVDWKSLLQEHLQALKLGTPVYTTVFEIGPEHAKQFIVHVEWNTHIGWFRGLGNSLKRAQQAAAREAYLYLTKGPSREAGILSV